MAYLEEDDLEDILEGQFQDLGYEVVKVEAIGPSGTQPEREALRDVVIRKKAREV